MSATGPDGVEWVRAAEALERIPGLRYRTLQSWWARGEVRRARVGRQVWVAWEDVLTHEAAAALVGGGGGGGGAPPPGGGGGGGGV